MDTNQISSSASQQQLDYMKLLVTQLRYQNPLEPMDNNDMAAQLARFSQLQQLENMNSTFAKVFANTHLGHQVAFLNSELNQTLSGVVQEIEMNGTEPILKVQVGIQNQDGQEEPWIFDVPLSSVTAIGN